MVNSVEEEGCTGLWQGIRRQARSLLGSAFEFRNPKEVDFAFSKCDPHPFPHPESDRLEHCYKYGKGSGKFYPVLLDQKLGDYVVKAKLGHGNFASVWQCVLDEGKERDLPYESVAVKVCTNSKKDSKDDVIEAKVLMKLNKRSDGKGDFGKNHIQKVDECFHVPGSFGDHFCIVGEAIGPSLDYYLNLTEKQQLGHFDTEVAKKIAFQILSSVTWLHNAGYGHGDIHPHNILMKEKGFKAGTNAKRPICIENTKPEDVPYMPPYLVSCIDDDLTARTPLTVDNCDARLVDFGQTFKKNQPRKVHKMTTPKGNRSPEWTLKNTPITTGIDIWSIACITYRMTTGKHLMWVEERYKDEHGKLTQKRTKADINEDHMPMMAELLGVPPAWMIKKWNTSGLPKIDWKSIKPEGNLHERILQDRPAGMSDEETALFEDFLRQALTWDYRYRPTAAELIQHDWFKSVLSLKDELHLSNLAKPTSRFSRAITKISDGLKSWPTRLMSPWIKKEDLEAQPATEVKALGPILGARAMEI
ncbi:hypothetical protein TWF481_003669 [Arthrobotrys musiformis]|uniref:Protein kinase domain-containing protein n=1 Tax=Arthrobotrys musiformis TaxID=47236 RepID=A0AAV9WH98_9PEZI